MMINNINKELYLQKCREKLAAAEKAMDEAIDRSRRYYETDEEDARMTTIYWTSLSREHESREKEILHNLEYGSGETAPKTLNSIQFDDAAAWAGAREVVVPCGGGKLEALCLQCRPDPESRDGTLTIVGIADRGEWS